MDATDHWIETSDGLPRVRKPRLALMGEFSAGKSTLTNILLGGDPMPTRVTATRLPPVWISWGDGPAVRVAHDGTETKIPVDQLETVPLEDTRLIRLYHKSETLELCDLIDMPGISDPNMAPDVWQNLIADVDAIVWCTHATQAWRQSEAATWSHILPQTRGTNILLITQFDKLQSHRDRLRVLARVERETGELFEGIYPIALLEALASGEDIERWKKSGAAPFTEHLVDLLLDLANPDLNEAVERQRRPSVPVETIGTNSDVEPEQPAQPEQPTPNEGDDETRVTPKRVRSNPDRRPRTRPLNPALVMSGLGWESGLSGKPA